MKKNYIIGLICILVIFSLSLTSAPSFSQEASEPPEEVIKKMLEDEDLPPELRSELEEMLKSGRLESVVVGTEEDKVKPPQLPRPDSTIIEMERREAGEEEEYREPEYEEPGRQPIRQPSRQLIEGPASRVAPEAKILPSTAANRISLDLKGVDIIDVLKMLSARSNLNIVAGRDVRGRVTLFLKDVDVWEAFEIILAANNLAYVKERDIINVMTERDYEQLYGKKYYSKEKLRIYRLEHAKVSEVSKALNQTKSKIGKVIIDEVSNTIILVDSPLALAEMEELIAKMDMPIETKVFSLDYAKAEDIKAKVSEILTKGLGTVQVDERTNKVIVTDLSKKMSEIAAIIDEIDEKHKEVLIEAKIVQVSLNDQYKYGVDWKLVFTKPQDKDDGENITEYNRTDFNFGEVLGTIGNIVTGSGADAYVTGGGLALANIASNNISAMIEVLQTLGKVNVISSPRITVLNNEEAKVLVGTNQPYIETTSVTTQAGTERDEETIKWVDVGIELTVTPTINKDGFVTMKIKPKISSADTWLGSTAARNRIPIVTTSETETTVMVKDGTTIVIAGLIEDRDEESENKVPFLGDVPILGYLFKSKSKGSTTVPEKKELVIFLTPYVIHGTETFPESDNVWYAKEITQRELLEQQMSRAVEDIRKNRSLLRGPRPSEEKKDMTTRISDKLKIFKDGEEIEALTEKRDRLEQEIEESEARGTVPEKLALKKETGVEPIVEKKARALPPSLAFPQQVSDYYSYYEMLRSKIYWFAKDTYPRGYRGGREDVVVRFIVTNDGRLKGEPSVLNGADEELAIAAKAAVEMAAPFAPFPKKMAKNEEVFRITIAYQ